MPPYRRRPTGRRRAPRRKSVWSTLSIFNTALAANTTAVNQPLQGLIAAGSSVLGVTIARVHASLSVASVDADTHPCMQIAFQVNDSSGGLPLPSDYFNDWMLNYQLTPGNSSAAVQTPAVAGGAYAPTGIIWGRDFDIRSKRRLHQMGDNFFVTVFNQGSQPVNYTLFIRTLVLLP